MTDRFTFSVFSFPATQRISSKLQAPENLQVPSPNRANAGMRGCADGLPRFHLAADARPRMAFGIWTLGFLWSLELGIWNLDAWHINCIPNFVVDLCRSTLSKFL
jgi:hypothetical protein